MTSADLQPGGSGTGSTVMMRCRECGEPKHSDEPWLHAECADDREANASSDEDQLRADLEAARSEIRHLIEDRDHALAVAKSEQQWTHAAWVEIEQLKERIRGQSVAELLDLIAARRDLQQSLADLAQARARIAVLERVDEAAREYSYNGHVPPCRVEYRHCTCGYTDLLRALDAAQAAQQPQPASDTTPALGDLQSPAPRQDAPEH